jgi:membrane protease YdiL (CAAX protease family)
VIVSPAGTVAVPRARRPVVYPLSWALAGAGVAALLARPWFLPAAVDVEWRVAFFVVLGVAGAAWPLVRPGALRPAPLSVSLQALAVGTAAFALGRTLVDVPLRPSGLALAIALNALAAVAEEAFFRRFLYGLVAPAFGTGAAVVGTAVAFALVHVTVWGWWVLPLDLAAGLVLSWQRAATDRWSVPAATHILANTLALL